MLACLTSAAVVGIETYLVHVEIDVSVGLPSFTMVGLPDTTVRESRDRVRSTIRNSDLAFPEHRITVNLAPADVRMGGSSFDLPIALGLLATSGASRAASSATSSSWASSHSTAASTASAACYPLPAPRVGSACRACLCRPAMRPRPVP